MDVAAGSGTVFHVVLIKPSHYDDDGSMPGTTR
jgi:hypothetical protein